jgi:putative lipase involved disintegration of autophagic bodies
MRFYPLFLLYFTLTEAYQQAFFSQNTPSDTVSLKSVYHRGSETGPIPHLFRKHYVDVSIQSTFAVDGVTGRIDRPAHVDRAFLASSQRPRWHGERPMHLESAMAFLPNVKDRASVHAMALMASNAYVDIGVNDTDWYDLGAPWSLVR